MVRRVHVCLLALFAVVSASPRVLAGDETVTDAQLREVFAAYQAAAARGFDIESMVAVYRKPNAAAAVKKLVDLAQSNPALSITKKHSLLMEQRRQEMNLGVLSKLARYTGGSVEVLNFGKLNGIRSDKDQTMFPVDGKRHFTGEEMTKKFKEIFKESYGVEMDAMDMAMFAAEGNVPDWRRADLTFREFVHESIKGDILLGKTRDAYRGGAYVAQVHGRSARMGRVTLVKYERKPDGTLERSVMEDLPACEASSRYKGWTADVPYRNAMDSVAQNLEKFRHSENFIDKMKYFNRTVGDGINALNQDDWDVDYIFHLKKLVREGKQGEIDSFIRKMTTRAFPKGVTATERREFQQVIRLAADIELDKMTGKPFPGEEHYLGRLVGVVESQTKREREAILTPQAKLAHARGLFFDTQERLMRYSLLETARVKIRRDMSKAGFQMHVDKYGKDLAKRLKWESAWRVRRIFHELDDDKLIGQIIGDAPADLRKILTHLHRLARSRRDTPERLKLRLPQDTVAQARRRGPEEHEVVSRKRSRFDIRCQRIDDALGDVRSSHPGFEGALRAKLNELADSEVAREMQQRLLNTLGYEERVVLRGMEVAWEHRFSGDKLLRNVVTLGNVQTALNLIQVYQQTDDWRQVAQAAAWELITQVPKVSEAWTLIQVINDPDPKQLAWMYISYKIPGAGQVKLVFDVAKQVVEIAFHAAFNPLAQDRFAQIYQGYIEKRAAGKWPTQEGWIERRDAANRSILHWVPGPTFVEKRDNMYRYFADKLATRFKAAGLDEEDPDFMPKRRAVLNRFFHQYVEDYFAWRGEWANNPVPQEIRQLLAGQLDSVKRRLKSQLLVDFELGEKVYDRAELAKWELEEALEKQRELVETALRQEKRVAAAESVLGDGIVDTYVRTGEQYEKGEVEKAVLEAYATPPVVFGDQKVSFAVKVRSANEGVAQTETHDVAVGLKRVATVIDMERATPDRLAQVVGDVRFLEPLLRQLRGTDAPVTVTRLTYEVVAKNSAGRAVATEEVTAYHVDRASTTPPPSNRTLLPPGLFIQDVGANRVHKSQFERMSFKVYLVPAPPRPHLLRLRVGTRTFHVWSRPEDAPGTAVFRSSAEVPVPGGRTRTTVSVEGMPDQVFFFERSEPSEPDLAYRRKSLQKAQARYQRARGAGEPRELTQALVSLLKEEWKLAKEHAKAEQWDQARRMLDSIESRLPSPGGVERDLGATAARSFRSFDNGDLLELKAEVAFFQADAPAMLAAVGWIRQEGEDFVYHTGRALPRDEYGKAADRYERFLDRYILAGGDQAGVAKVLPLYVECRRRSGTYRPEREKHRFFCGGE